MNYARGEVCCCFWCCKRDKEDLEKSMTNDVFFRHKAERFAPKDCKATSTPAYSDQETGMAYLLQTWDQRSKTPSKESIRKQKVAVKIAEPAKEFEGPVSVCTSE